MPSKRWSALNCLCMAAPIFLQGCNDVGPYSIIAEHYFYPTSAGSVDVVMNLTYEVPPGTILHKGWKSISRASDMHTAMNVRLLGQTAVHQTLIEKHSWLFVHFDFPVPLNGSKVPGLKHSVLVAYTISDAVCGGGVEDSMFDAPWTDQWADEWNADLVSRSSYAITFADGFQPVWNDVCLQATLPNLLSPSLSLKNCTQSFCGSQLQQLGENSFGYTAVPGYLKSPVFSWPSPASRACHSCRSPWSYPLSSMQFSGPTCLGSKVVQLILSLAGGLVLIWMVVFIVMIFWAVCDECINVARGHPSKLCRGGGWSGGRGGYVGGGGFGGDGGGCGGAF